MSNLLNALYAHVGPFGVAIVAVGFAGAVVCLLEIRRVARGEKGHLGSLALWAIGLTVGIGLVETASGLSNGFQAMQAVPVALRSTIVLGTLSAAMNGVVLVAAVAAVQVVLVAVARAVKANRAGVQPAT